MTGLMVARRAGGADVPDMYRIYSRNLDDRFDPGVVEFLMLQWPRGQIVAGPVTGGTAGALSSYILDDGAVSVALLAVDAPYRGLGAGSALLDRLVPEAMGAGAPRIQLEARVTNLRAISFYERRGFRRTCRLPSLYSDGGDGVRMVLDLGRAGAAGRPRRRRPPRLRPRSPS